MKSGLALAAIITACTTAPTHAAYVKYVISLQGAKIGYGNYPDYTYSPHTAYEILTISGEYSTSLGGSVYDAFGYYAGDLSFDDSSTTAAFHFEFQPTPAAERQLIDIQLAGHPSEDFPAFITSDILSSTYSSMPGHSGLPLLDATITTFRAEYSTTPFTNNPGLTLDVASYAPEVSTWAMILIGFGAVGGAMRQQTMRRTIRSVKAEPQAS